MDFCVALQNLSPCKNSIIVFIQVVKIYHNHFDHYADEKIIVVVDEKGFRMPMTIRSKELNQFQKKLQQGLWYYIYNAEVGYKSMKNSFSTSPFHLFLNHETVVKPFTGDKISMMYDFKDIPKIENIYNHISVVDVIGVVFEIYRTIYEEVVVRPYDIVPAERSIFFVFKDFNGKTIECVVKNNFHDRFLQAWLTTKPHYPTICVLHLWDIRPWEGRLALFANNKYSNFAFEPDIRELDDARKRLHFSDQFVRFYDDYALHPARPSE